MLLFYQLKSYHHPALRDSNLMGLRRFNDVSAILDCKDKKKNGRLQIFAIEFSNNKVSLNVPPLVPSPSSKADVQKAEGT